MVSSTACANFLNFFPSSSNPSPFSKVNTFSPKPTHLHHPLSLQCICTSPSTRSIPSPVQTQTHALSLPSTLRTPSFHADTAVSDKLNRLASEFHALSEPIERVKRLLHYAAMLPPLEDSDRVPKNRVAGCSTQVWLVSEMDEGGRMRFRADSDSEISKGFCWCLVWMLDGAEPHEVLRVGREDLAGMNVGLNVKAQSRVNTWHNVLFGMQKATKDLVLHNAC